MEIKKFIPEWVPKVLLWSHALKTSHYAREQLDRLVQEEQDKAKKEAENWATMETLRNRNFTVEIPVEKLLELREEIKELEQKVEELANGN